jgi:hypothetical protein
MGMVKRIAAPYGVRGDARSRPRWLFDDRSADRKFHAEAFGSRNEKRFEDASRCGRVQSRAD